MERHHGRREPPRAGAFRDPTRDAGRERVELRAAAAMSRGWSSPRCWRRPGSREELAPQFQHNVEAAGEMLDELATGWSRFFMTSSRRAISPGVRSQHRLRPGRDRIDAARVETHPAVTCLARLVPRRRDRAGGRCRRTASHARIRGPQLVVRVHGPADAPLRHHLHPAQTRRPAVQVRAQAVRRLHRREARSTSAGRSRERGRGPERCCRPSSV